MTDQQRLFVDAYVGEARGNATQAARVAGYAEPNKSGWRVRNEPDVKAEIERRLTKSAMSADEVLWRVSAVARASMADAFRAQTVHSYSLPILDFTTLFETGLIHAVKTIKQGKYGPEIQLQDGVAALKLLMQYHGLLKPNEDNADEDALSILRRALGIAPDNGSNQPTGDGTPPVELETPLTGTGTVD
jgi:hypothetical protein